MCRVLIYCHVHDVFIEYRVNLAVILCGVSNVFLRDEIIEIINNNTVDNIHNYTTRQKKVSNT